MATKKPLKAVKPAAKTSQPAKKVAAKKAPTNSKGAKSAAPKKTGW